METATIGEKIPILIRAPIYDVSGYSAHARDLVLALHRSNKFNVNLDPIFWAQHSYVRMTPEDENDIAEMVKNEFDVFDRKGVLMTISVPHEFKVAPMTTNIGVTAGIETNKVSETWANACEAMHATIVSSRHSKDGFLNAGVTTPVYVIGEGAEPFDEAVHKSHIRQLDNIETDFNFLTAGQWGHPQAPIGADRKDMTNLVLWFLQGFQGRRGVGLIMKTYSSNDSTVDWLNTQERIKSIREAVGGGEYPKIHLIHGTMTDLELARLYHHPKINAFVTISHGECWGRHISEAASAGLPLLVTGWGAHTEYLSSVHSVFFEYELVDIHPAAVAPPMLEAGSQWAQCKKEHVTRMMRRCVSKYDVAKEKALEQQEFILERHSKKAAMDEFINTVEETHRKVQSSSSIITRI